MSVKTYTNSLKKVKASKGKVSKPITGHESYSTPNYGGGYSLKMSPQDVLERFLILGVEGSFYYVGKNELLENNTKNIISLVNTNPQDVYNATRDISINKRAISNDPAIYVTALLCAHPKQEIRQLGYSLVPQVCRTGTHVFHFCEMITKMRGWSRGLRNAVNSFYTTKNWDQLVYQVLKYRQRDGWSVKDVFRCTHPDFGRDKLKNSLAHYIVNSDRDETAFGKLNDYCLFGEEAKGSKQIVVFLDISKWKESEKSKKQMKDLIKYILFADLTQEFIPTWYKNEPEVQEALLQKMPLMATIRNLGAYSASGLLGPFNSNASKLIVDRITNFDILSKAGVHPLQVMTASKIYNNGRGLKGSLTWNPNSQISSALETCFNLSFKSAPVVGKNFMISVDVSGSMSSNFQEYPFTYCEVAACIALAMVKREPSTYVVGFNNQLHDLNFTEKDTLESAVRKASKYCGYTTDAGKPIEKAIKDKLPVDVFLHITDSDFNAGKHPLTLVEEFRKKMNRPKTRLMSVGLVPSHYGTVGFASELDKYSMDIKGFDTSIPQIIHSFCSDKPIVKEESED